MGETRILSNGAVYDMERKRITANPGGGTTAITQANASALSTRRWDLAKRAAARGLLDGVNRSGVVSVANQPVEAWGEIIGHAAELVMISDNTRGVAELSRFIGQASDMLPDNKQQQEPGITVTANIPVDQLAPLLDALRQERERRTVDATAHDTPTAHLPPTTTNDETE